MPRKLNNVTFINNSLNHKHTAIKHIYIYKLAQWHFNANATKETLAYIMSNSEK